ncbi:MAG: peptidylprolyl isomerase [Actinomycetota bacterium]
MPSRSRQRQLAKLAQRRQQERRRQRRQRILAIVVALVVALGGGAFAAVALLGGNDKPAASASNTPAATPTPSVSPSAPPGPVACGGKKPAAADSVAAFNGKYSKAPAMTIDPSKTYVATMQTSCGAIEIELDAKGAPNTVNSLVFLIKQHYFDGGVFHRIVPNFVIQGGDPSGSGTGGPGYSTVDTPPANAQYPVGTIAMAKTGSEAPGTSGSQFFVVTADTAQQALAPGGVGQYAIVGHVTAGMDVVTKIAQVPVAGPNGDTPQEKVYIEKVTVTEK